MRHTLLIGGSYGIGKAIATQLIEQGEKVTIASRSTEDLPTGAAHIEFDALSEDTSVFESIDAIDGFVYCPGSINLRPFTNLKEKDFKGDMEINFHGMVRSVQAVLTALKKGDNPSIVLFSTVAVSTGMAFHTSVAAAKGAVEGFGRALAAEMAPKVRVNILAPSLVDTPLAARIMGNEKMKKSTEDRHPMKRVGRPEDIASMACHLLSEHATWITGQVIHVDGGMGSLKA